MSDWRAAVSDWRAAVSGGERLASDWRAEKDANQFTSLVGVRKNHQSAAESPISASLISSAVTPSTARGDAFGLAITARNTGITLTHVGVMSTVLILYGSIFVPFKFSTKKTHSGEFARVGEV